MFSFRRKPEEWYPNAFLTSHSALEHIKAKKLKGCGAMCAGEGKEESFWVVRKGEEGYEVLCTDNKFRTIELWV